MLLLMLSFGCLAMKAKKSKSKVWNWKLSLTWLAFTNGSSNRPTGTAL